VERLRIVGLNGVATDTSGELMYDGKPCPLLIAFAHRDPPCSWGAPDGRLGLIHFLNGVARGATNIGSGASPGPGFLTGTLPPRSRRPLSRRPQSLASPVSIHLRARDRIAEQRAVLDAVESNWRGLLLEYRTGMETMDGDSMTDFLSFRARIAELLPGHWGRPSTAPHPQRHRRPPTPR